MPLKSVCSRIPQRWVVCALCSLAIAIISYKNTSFYEIADVVDSIRCTRPIPKPRTEECPNLYNGSVWRDRDLPFVLPDVYWTPNISIIDLDISALHLGKILMIIPAGVLSDMGYSKGVLVGGMLLVSLSHFTRPVLVENMTAEVLGNVVEGIGEAGILPAVISLISRWTPSWERNLFTAIIVGGYYYGDMFGHLLFNLIYHGTSSWSIGHYITGIVGSVWSGLCFAFVYHAPDLSPFITPHEFRTITSARRKSSLLAKLQKLQGIPWYHIVKSPPFLSLVLVFCSLQWTTQQNIVGNFKDYQSYILSLPKKFSDESSVARIVTLPSILIGGFLADYITKRNYLRKIVVKRLFTFIGLVFSSALTVTACFVGCSVTLFWILSISGCFILGPAFPVIFCAPVDLSPRHAGLLAAIMDGVVTISTLFSFKIKNLLITDKFNVNQWRLRVVVWAGLTVIMMIPFLFFGSAENQRWRSRRRTSTVENRPPSQLQTTDEMPLQPLNSSILE